MKLNTMIAFLLWLLGMSLIVLIQVHAWQPYVETTAIKHDPRIGNLTRFFDKYHCPYRNEKFYIQTADKYQIDYRLLPALSVIESSCGRHYLYNNLFGWGSAIGLRKFESIDQGVDFVAGQLTQGGYYKGKTLEAKLKIYNSVNPNYTQIVKGLMKQIE